MNGGGSSMGGISTAHGLAGWLFLMAALVLVFHWVGFRVIFTAGRSVG